MPTDESRTAARPCSCGREKTIVDRGAILCAVCGATWQPRSGFSDPAFEQGYPSEWDRVYHPPGEG